MIVTLVYHDVPAVTAENLSAILPYLGIRLPRPLTVDGRETMQVYPIASYEAQRDQSAGAASTVYTVTVNLVLTTQAWDGNQEVTVHTTTDFRDQLDRTFGVLFFESPLAARDQITSHTIQAPPQVQLRSPGRVVGRIGKRSVLC